jgi:AbrB family looped-hinge helix DNA binding protein
VTVRITSKGQVTIPQGIRERIGLLPDTEVEFEVVGDAVRIRKARSSQARGRSLVARLKGRADQAMTTDEIMKLTRG